MCSIWYLKNTSLGVLMGEVDIIITFSYWNNAPNTMYVFSPGSKKMEYRNTPYQVKEDTGLW